MPELGGDRGGSRPLLTYYDDATGERTELSAATLDNWVAKTANLIVDGHGLGFGDVAAVLLPPHWQTAVVLLGCRAAGLTVVTSGSADIAFAVPDRVAEAGAPDVYALGLAALAAPLRPGPPPGTADYVVEVRAYGDRFAGPGPGGTGPAGTGPGGARAAGDTAAATRAAELGIRPGDRVLVDAGTHPDPADWLLAPLSAGASIVLCRHLDRARLADRVTAERVTRVLPAAS